jgi:hypothetical protein
MECQTWKKRQNSLQEQMYNLEIQNLSYNKSNSILLTCLWIKNSAGTERAQKWMRNSVRMRRTQMENAPECRNAGVFSYVFVLWDYPNETFGDLLAVLFSIKRNEEPFGFWRKHKDGRTNRRSAGW